MSSVKVSQKDQAIEDEIALLTNKVPKGTGDALDCAIRAYLKEMFQALPAGAKFAPQPATAPFAFSYAGNYQFRVLNPETTRGFGGNLTLEPDEDGGGFDATGDFTFAGEQEGCVLSGRGVLDNLDILLLLEVTDAGFPATFDAGIACTTPMLVWRPIGNIYFQQSPEDGGLNGDLELTPAAPEDGNTTYTVIKLPRLGANGRQVYSGSGQNRKMVYDCFFFRDGKWWKIKDPSLKVPGQKELVDLRDGTGNPNFEPADTASSDRLNRVVFATGWQEFWEGFSEATARQLQGLAVTLGALTGVNLAVFRKIKRLRNQGKSWAAIWDECWIDILLIVGLAIVMSIPIGKFLGKIFGPFIRRLKSKLFRPPTPPVGGVTPPPVHPPISPRRSRQDLINILSDYLAALRRTNRDLIRQLRELNRPSGQFKGSARFKGATRRKLQREIDEIGQEIERVRRTLGGMGIL